MSQADFPKPPDVAEQKEEIAIIGMSCIFPGAPDLKIFWQNIISKVNSITDPPVEAWESDIYYDPESTENDRVYCKRGGYIGSLAHFDPVEHGIMPTAVEGGEPDQWLALQVARNALNDAGYKGPPPEGHRTAVILGKGNYLNRGNLSLVQNNLVIDQTLAILQKLHPDYTSNDLAAIRQEMKRCLPLISAETVGGLIPNVIAGRIANRLDLMGPCYTVDGACASSLLAMDIAVHELLDGRVDLALVGGSQVSTPVPVFGVFCQLNALSRKEQIRPFDKDADGTILGEGIGMIVLKRRSDAVRDRNRIYAIIKGVGTSSDGRGLGVLAPRVEGQVLALQRAYEAAGVSPSTIGLIEAHGTGTPAGDLAELQSLTSVFGNRTTSVPRCAIGSVKSMIGHTMPAAGIAGIIKASLALYHKMLPPTLNIDTPNPKLELEKTPFYINTETRPWIHGFMDSARRAGINAFGFGGINAHIILEEHREATDLPEGALHSQWDSEVFIIQGKTRDDLLIRGGKLQRYIAEEPHINLKNLAFTLNGLSDDTPYRLSIVASSQETLADLLAYALKQLSKKTCTRIQDRRGIYYFQEPLKVHGKLAFLFPGEGSQYVNMLSDLCMHFPEVRQCFDNIDRIFTGHSRGYLISDYIFPPPTFSEAERKAAEKKLWEMDGAVEAVLTANDALFTLARHLEIKPDVMLGHSTGEYSAMHASGIFSLIESSDNGQRARDLNKHYAEIAEKKDIPRARLAAVGADSDKVAQLIARFNKAVYIAMDNCPHQTVIAGAEADVQKAVEEMNNQGIICQILPFDRPYHTPLFKDYADTLQQFFQQWPINVPAAPVYSCTTTAPFPSDSGAIRKLAVEHWVRRVEFRKTIEKMFADGVRIFVEIGPRGNLTAFVDDILRGKDYVAVPANTERSSGINQLNHLIGILAAHGVCMNTDYLYKYRSPQRIELYEHSNNEKKGAPLITIKKIATGWPAIKISDKTANQLMAKNVSPQNNYTPSADTSTVLHESMGDIPTPFNFDTIMGTSLPSLDTIRQTVNGHTSKSEIMSGYLTTMEHFLEVQQQVMQTFLSSVNDESLDTKTIGKNKNAGAPFAPGVAEPFPVKKSEGTVLDKKIHGDDLHTIRQDLIEIVSERTGYPADMLDLTLNMEADLGIDSIKRTEIIGALNERYGRKLGQETEQLTRLKTLQQIVDFFEKHSESFVNEAAEHIQGKQPAEEASRTNDESSRDMLHAYPMIDRIESIIEGQELVALKRVSPDEDLYLYDHTLGGRISCMDTSLRPLPVIPLTLSMEILAEAASLLEPDAILIGMQNIRTYKWVALEGESINLKIVARRIQENSSEIAVKMYNLNEKKSPVDYPVIEGTMVFSDRYPDAPVLDNFKLNAEQDSQWIEEQLYTKAMFHGPSWQGVASVDRRGDDGTIATLTVLPVNGFFKSNKNPSFVTDPVVLDAAGQVIGFWTMEHLKTGFTIFPFRVNALHIYRSQLAVQQKVTCRARIKLVGDTQVLSDIDMIGEDGCLWMRLEGWEDKRFDLPLIMYKFLLSPIDVIPSTKWDEPFVSFTDESSFFCRRTGQFSKGDEKFWGQVFSYIILNKQERELFNNLGDSEERRTQWLMGRLAAKDAVRALLKEHYGIKAGPADIEIQNDRYGCPVPTGNWKDKIDGALALSLSHTNDMAAAVVTNSRTGKRIGIDIERIRYIDDGFMVTAFTSAERDLLNSVDAANRTQWTLRFWCAKEAVAKALGRGLSQGPQNLIIEKFDVLDGTVNVRLQKKLSEEFPKLAQTVIRVYSYQEEDYIYAGTICQGDS